MHPDSQQTNFAGRLLAWLGWLAAISCAAAFSFAGVLALAAVVAALAATLALARIVAFAGVLVGSILVLVPHFDGDTSFRTGLNSMRTNSKRTAHQAGNRCAGNHRFLCHVTFPFWFGFYRTSKRPIPLGVGKKAKTFQIPCLFATQNHSNAYRGDGSDTELSLPCEAQN